MSAAARLPSEHAFPKPAFLILPSLLFCTCKNAVSYVLRIEGRPYTIHLQQQFFLPDDFRIYTYNEKGSLRSNSPHIKGGCHYRGYVEGFPSSAVTLSTCSGLRGLLQFENVSYGIEPLGYSPAFEHFVYRVSDERMAGSLLANSHPESGPGRLTAEMSTKARGGDEHARTYIIPIEGIPRTVRLRQQVFLPEDFRIYTDGRGGLAKSELAHIERDCFYEGYIEGFPVSLVALSTCSGLSGILQLVNASYGIKPLEVAAGYQHLVYPMWNENIETQLFIENSALAWTVEVSLKPEDAIASKQAVRRPSWYLEMHAVLDKSLFDYMGADKDAVTAKIVQLFSYVNSMFARLNLTIVLSSLELWTEKNKIPTTGDVEELLQRFLQWKNVHRVLRLQDITFLFVYREQSHYMGASSAKKLCLKNHAGGVALYQRAMTLEAFAVVMARLLGLSLGMAYDDPGSCHCAGATCIMQASSVHLAGVKAFSSCSIRDFQHFLATGGGQCLLNRPAMDTAYKAPVCGNKVVEPGEACDCGTTEECQRDPCCTIGCKLRRGVQCLSGPCCQKCKFVKKGTLCRSSSEDECELKEYCNGTSGECTPDLWVMDGHPCSRNTAFCYRGVCQTANKQCQKVFGRGAKNGPLACYEEINSQRDRMGHCGSNRHGYQHCAWKDLRCGKLVCEYLGSKPFTKEKAAVIYARVQNTLCVTLDYMKPLMERDPMLVNDGTVCDDHKICLNQQCVPATVLNYKCEMKTKCHDHGVCNNQGSCHCHPGWKPPTCQEKAGVMGEGSSSPSGDDEADVRSKGLLKLWLLLTFCLFVPVAVGLVFLVLRRSSLRHCLAVEDLDEDKLKDKDCVNEERGMSDV
ncbi:PREDICTED: disintegrin and metalloproteinase domain-containing protein 2-like [Haliaeetus leucocephalus]|uniref:disintegrin and metalloproteinase domain-containing protein 2-like n=1 Tax=Haliaeetus leucocephalus TaxID=52644 RepID=UPI00053CB521|nr:PREDICTED: disintegrin and metalloproteinase domain-containing protein 2-like [Haliaeetus leucocephalus]